MPKKIIELSPKDTNYIKRVALAQNIVNISGDELVQYFRNRKLRILYNPATKDLTRCAQWLDNIVCGKSEQNLICYQDDVFLLVASSEWKAVKDIDSISNVNAEQLTQMHYLAVPKTHDLKSILDLNAEHVHLLEHIKTTIIEQLCSLYKFNANEIVLFFHYPPSAPHLHIHVKTLTSIKNARSLHTNIINCHPIDQVIKNIRDENDYYQTHTIPYVKILHQ